MRCRYDPSCVASDNHSGLCVRIDGTLIMQRPAEVRREPADDAGFTHARDVMQRSKAIREFAAQDTGDAVFRGENTSPRHTVRHPDAEAQIAAAHEPEVDVTETWRLDGKREVAQHTIRFESVDDALEERASEIRSCAHVTFDRDCASCHADDWGHNAGDPPGTMRRFKRTTTPAGKLEALFSAVRSGDMPPDVNDPLEDVMRREHAKQATNPGPVFAVPGDGTADYSSAPIAGTLSVNTGRGPYRIARVDEARPRSFDERAAARVYERADLALAMGTLERIAATVMPGTETWTADELQHAVATVQIERNEARAWAAQTKPRLEDALAKLRDTSTLEPDDAVTLDAFGRTCAALETHAEQGQALQVAYRNALQAVSAMAARRNRGK